MTLNNLGPLSQALRPDRLVRPCSVVYLHQPLSCLHDVLRARDLKEPRRLPSLIACGAERLEYLRRRRVTMADCDRDGLTHSVVGIQQRLIGSLPLVAPPPLVFFADLHGQRFLA
ncbi:hypothetical protein [Streptomyces cadmiisoli]|uniref:hypothetical protein n=1 Tax=Streptomyces cadmiisoli TaxID=2184053 RepID=UPI00365E33FA